MEVRGPTDHAGRSIVSVRPRRSFGNPKPLSSNLLYGKVVNTALFLVCRLISRETRDTFYKQNMDFFQCTSDALQDSIEVDSGDYKHSIHQITLAVDEDQMIDGFVRISQIASAYPSLKQLDMIASEALAGKFTDAYDDYLELTRDHTDPKFTKTLYLDLIEGRMLQDLKSRHARMPIEMEVKVKVLQVPHEQ